jgi:hypothetical protein
VVLAPLVAVPLRVEAVLVLQLALEPIALFERLLFIALLVFERCADMPFPGIQLAVFDAPLVS